MGTGASQPGRGRSQPSSQPEREQGQPASQDGEREPAGQPRFGGRETAGRANGGKPPDLKGGCKAEQTKQDPGSCPPPSPGRIFEVNHRNCIRFPALRWFGSLVAEPRLPRQDRKRSPPVALRSCYRQPTRLGLSLCVPPRLIRTRSTRSPPWRTGRGEPSSPSRGCRASGRCR
jgi:hypothetical protein